MRTTAALAASVAASACLLMLGCSHGGRPASVEDGEPCAEQTWGERVYIDVAYDARGRPAVWPEDCHVRQGALVTFRTEPGVLEPFAIEFKEHSAAGRGEPRYLGSEPGRSDRQRVRLMAGNVVGTYRYTIIANDIRVDPAIIIDR